MRVHLQGGAVARNVFWQVAGVVSIGTTAHFKGNHTGEEKHLTEDWRSHHRQTAGTDSGDSQQEQGHAASRPDRVAVAPLDDDADPLIDRAAGPLMVAPVRCGSGTLIQR